jgi:hypothetical protein
MFPESSAPHHKARKSDSSLDRAATSGYRAVPISDLGSALGVHLRAFGAIDAFREVETLVLLVNNRGYVVESEIHDGPYNYIKNWDYAGLIPAWNAEDGRGLGLKATTAEELASAIERARNHHGGPVLIECQIQHDDCSRQLLKWGARVAHANARPPQQG